MINSTRKTDGDSAEPRGDNKPMSIELQFPLTVGGVVRATGYSESRIRQLDDELHPHRGPNGRRCYSIESVEKFLAKRGR